MENRTLLQNFRKIPTFNTTAMIILKLIVMVIPITQTVMGGLYLHECPVKPYIPVYLLVSGSITLAIMVTMLLPCAHQPEDGSLSTLNNLCSAWNTLVSLFMFCWFLTGNVWIYSVYPPSYIPGTLKYCAKSLYLFAFWITTVAYILLVLSLLLCCCSLPLMHAYRRSLQSNDAYEELIREQSSPRGGP